MITQVALLIERARGYGMYAFLVVLKVSVVFATKFTKFQTF
jgi:hypothetical protein